MHLLIGAAIPYVVNAIRLGSQQEFSQNLNKEVSSAISKPFQIFCSKRTLVVGFVTDSPNVLVKSRKPLGGAVDGGTHYVAYGYGYVCHALSLFSELLLKHRLLTCVVRQGLVLAHYFKLVHLAKHELEAERSKCNPTAQTVKSIPKT